MVPVSWMGINPKWQNKSRKTNQKPSKHISVAMHWVFQWRIWPKKSELLNDVIDTVGEVTVLAKCSPNRKQLLESFQSYLQCDDNDEGFEQNTSHFKLCVTRWIVKATTYMKVLTNYESLIKLWDTSLECFIDRGTQARIVVCHAQMANVQSQADFFIVWIQHTGYMQWQIISAKRFTKNHFPQLMTKEAWI